MTEKKNNTLTHNTKSLSVQVSLNGLCFLIRNDQADLLHHQEIHFPMVYTPQEVLLEIKKHLEENAALFQGITQLTVIHQNSLYSLVPKKFFEEDKMPLYLKLNAQIFETDSPAYDEIDPWELVVTYIPLTNVNNYFFELFGEFTFKHSITDFMEQKIHASDQQQAVYVYMRTTFMDVLVFQNQKMTLVNSFHYSCPEDFIYYLLFVAEQLNLDPENFQLYLQGNIQANDEYYAMAYSYIRHIHLENSSPLTLT
jgi:hypothetical protein